MTAPERETAGTVRSAHLAYFLPPDWARVARIAVPALKRIPRDSTALQLLVIVPDAGAALSLARAVAALPAAEGLRVVAATSAARAKRLLTAGAAHVVIGAPATLAPVVATAGLKLDEVTAVLFASADEFDAEDTQIATILTEVPRTAARMLTALEASPSVEALLERYLHKARRVMDDVTPAPDAPTSPTVRFLTVSGVPSEALPAVLDEVDAPSTTIVATDEAAASAARALLAAIGYRDGALAHVTLHDVPENSALVVLLGVPTVTVWSNVVASQPAQVVALIAPREHAALQHLAGATPVQAFAARGAVLKARASDARARAELREVLAAGVPSREVLALEPLLGEFDGLEIAAAALRLLERTRSSQAELVQATELRVRTVLKEAQQNREAAETGDRPEREGRTGGFGPRGDRGDRSDRGDRGDRPRGFAPRGDRGDRGDRPRTFAPRGDKPAGSGPRGDKPRGFAPRGDKPSGFGPRGDKPAGSGPRGDKPRGPRRDDGGRGPRGPR